MRIQGFESFCQSGQQFLYAAGFIADGLNNWAAEIVFKFRYIELESLMLGIVTHIEYQHHGYMKFCQLSG